MNRQAKYKNGILIGRGIEWTHVYGENTGFTWNPIGGCLHECQWQMPDGSIATCYAKETALKFRAAYPDKFEHHYWRPGKLNEPIKQKAPSGIFLDSMADLGGHWVPPEQAAAVLDICRQADWHTFQLLTKNPKRLVTYDLPSNVWAGFSTPPDFMWGKPLSIQQQAAKITADLEAMSQVKATIKWASVEPLSWDVASYFEGCGLDWVVIGAASNGPKKYQPEQGHVKNLLNVLDRQSIPVFFKGNLQGNPAAIPWRENFPALKSSDWASALTQLELIPA